MFIMMIGPKSGSNSCIIEIDGILIDCGDAKPTGTGVWQYDTATEKTWVADLTEGEHTLTLYVREDGIGPNQIVLRNQFDSSDLEKGVMLEESEREIVSVTE